MVYDIRLNDLNQIVVDLYSYELKYADKERYYHFELINSIIGEDLKVLIPALIEKGMISATRFETSDFDCISSTPYYTMKSLFLATNHQLLEKVYEVLDNSIIRIYVTCINVKTGEVKTITAGEYGLYDEEKEALLKELGYKSIKSSYTGKSLNDKITLKRKK